MLFAFTSTPVRYMDVEDDKRAEAVDEIVARIARKKDDPQR